MGVQLSANLGTVLAATNQAQGGTASMLPLLIIGGLLIAFMMWSNRRRQKRAAEFRSKLRPGQRVQLYAGLLGTIVTIGEREVFIELAPGVVVSAVPQAVQGIVEDPTSEQEALEPTATAEANDEEPDASDR